MALFFLTKKMHPNYGNLCKKTKTKPEQRSGLHSTFTKQPRCSTGGRFPVKGGPSSAKQDGELVIFSSVSGASTATLVCVRKYLTPVSAPLSVIPDYDSCCTSRYVFT